MEKRGVHRESGIQENRDQRRVPAAILSLGKGRLLGKSGADGGVKIVVSLRTSVCQGRKKKKIRTLKGKWKGRWAGILHSWGGKRPPRKKDRKGAWPRSSRSPAKPQKEVASIKTKLPTTFPQKGKKVLGEYV